MISKHITAKLSIYSIAVLLFSSAHVYSVRSVTEDAMRDFRGHTINQWTDPERIKSSLPLDELIQECVETVFFRKFTVKGETTPECTMILERMPQILKEIIAAEENHPDCIPFVHATTPIESFLSMFRQVVSEEMEGKRLPYPALRRLRETAQFVSISEFTEQGKEALTEEYKRKFCDTGTISFEEPRCNQYVRGINILENQITKPVMISCNFTLFNNRDSNDDVTDNESTISYFKSCSGKAFYAIEETEMFFKKLGFSKDIASRRLQRYISLAQKYEANYLTGELYHILVPKNQLLKFVRITKDFGRPFEDTPPMNSDNDVEKQWSEKFSTPKAQARLYLSSPGIDSRDLKINGPYRVTKKNEGDETIANELRKLVIEDIKYARGEDGNSYEQHCPNKSLFREIVRLHADEMQQGENFQFQVDDKKWESSFFQLSPNTSLEQILKLPLRYDTIPGDVQWGLAQFHKDGFNELVINLQRID